jgi:hypothetical protein
MGYQGHFKLVSIELTVFVSQNSPESPYLGTLPTREDEFIQAQVTRRIVLSSLSTKAPDELAISHKLSRQGCGELLPSIYW